MDYYETPEGQLLTGAHKYLTAARLLRESETWSTNSELLHTPTLHLLSHSIELLLKVTPLRRGGNYEDLRRSHGHDIQKLWEHPDDLRLKKAVYERAVNVWFEAASSGKWPNDNFSDDPKRVIDKAIADLSALHGRQTDFALRYVVQPGTTAPRPMFMIEVFGDIAERRVMNPSLLDY
jgi:hypothetical protein